MMTMKKVFNQAYSLKNKEMHPNASTSHESLIIKFKQINNHPILFPVLYCANFFNNQKMENFINIVFSISLLFGVASHYLCHKCLGHLEE